MNLAQFHIPDYQDPKPPSLADLQKKKELRDVEQSIKESTVERTGEPRTMPMGDSGMQVNLPSERKKVLDEEAFYESLSLRNPKAAAEYKKNFLENKKTGVEIEEATIKVRDAENKAKIGYLIRGINYLDATGDQEGALKLINQGERLAKIPEQEWTQGITLQDKDNVMVFSPKSPKGTIVNKDKILKADVTSQFLLEEKGKMDRQMAELNMRLKSEKLDSPSKITAAVINKQIAIDQLKERGMKEEDIYKKYPNLKILPKEQDIVDKWEFGDLLSESMKALSQDPSMLKIFKEAKGGDPAEFIADILIKHRDKLKGKLKKNTEAAGNPASSIEERFKKDKNIPDGATLGEKKEKGHEVLKDGKVIGYYK